MFGVECFDTHDEPISHYTQWDINQTLKIVLYGMDDGYVKNAPYVHFANIKSSEALVVRSTLQDDDTVLVDIPNQLLQEPYPLLIYVYLNDSSDASSQRTIVKIEIPVQKRAKPSDYEYVENIDRVTAEVIKQEIYDDFMDEIRDGNLSYPQVTFVDGSTGKHVNLKVSDGKLGLYVDSDMRQLLDAGDIANNLMTNDSSKVLSASMGTTLKNMIDVIPDQIDEKIDTHDSSSSAHSDIRGDIADVSNMVDTMQDEITEVQSSIAGLEGKLDDVGAGLDGSMSGNDVLTTTEALVGSTPIEMRIQGNTVQNLWVNPINTQNGVAITESDDGGITITGTTTATTTVMTDAIYTMRPSTTYSIGADKMTNASGFVFSVYQYSSEDGLLAGSDSVTNTSKGRTITTNSQMAYVKFVVVIPSGTTVSETYHVMLNEGEELKPWCKPGLNSVDEISVVTTGKNLFMVKPGAGLTDEGVTYEYLGDGAFHVHGTATGTSYCAVDYTGTVGYLNYVNLRGKTLTTSRDSDVVCCYFGYFVGQVGGSYKSMIDLVSGESASAVVPDDATWARTVLSVASGVTVDEIVHFQLELGPAATDYETPQVTTTPIDLDGNSLRSLPDGTCDELTVDMDGSVTLTQRVGIELVNGDNVEVVSSGTDSQRYIVTIDGLVTSPDAPDAYVPFNRSMNDRLHKAVHSLSPGMSLYTSSIPRKAGAYFGIEISDLSTAKARIDGAKILYPLVTPKTVTLPSVTLPELPSGESNIYTTSNVPTTSMTVRYWKKSGELVENLYDKLAQLQSTISSIQEAVTQP